MVEVLVIILISASVIAGALLLSKYSALKKFNRLAMWMVNNVRIGLDVFEAKKEYKDITLVALKYSVLLEAIDSGMHSDEAIKEWVAKFVMDTYIALGQEGLPKEKARQIAFSLSVLLNERKELLALINSFANHEDIEVKKITVVAIDSIGELYDLRYTLDRDMFKHVIVAINRCLLFLRDGGYNKKTYTKIGLTLHRLRIIMKSYNTQKNSQNLTIRQLHEKMATVLGTLDNIFN